MLICYAGQHVQHMQGTLEEINVKLAEVPGWKGANGQKRHHPYGLRRMSQA